MRFGINCIMWCIGAYSQFLDVLWQIGHMHLLLHPCLKILLYGCGSDGNTFVLLFYGCASHDG